MKRIFVLFVICVFGGLMLAGCQRDEGVQAGYEQGSETYQPRTAPKAAAPDQPSHPQIRGELISVSVPRRTFSIRVDNGMEQTFSFDDQTTVAGLEPATAKRVRDLVGKEGSEVTIQWNETGNAAKMATHVTVTQLAASTKPRKGKKGS